MSDNLWDSAAEELKGRPKPELEGMKADDRTGLVEKELERRREAGERG